jgi:hypothetical protein
LLRYVRFAFRNLAPQSQLSGVRNILRNAEADVGEVAVGVTREGPRAANTQVLQRELRVGQRRDLRGNLLGGLPALPRCLDLRIILFRFLQQIGQRSDYRGVLRCGLLRERFLPEG